MKFPEISSAVVKHGSDQRETLFEIIYGEIYFEKIASADTAMIKFGTHTMNANLVAQDVTKAQ